MTTTVQIPEDVLRKAMQAAGTESAEEAIVKALEEYARHHSQGLSQKNLIQHLGTFEDFMTPQELEEMRRMD